MTNIEIKKEIQQTIKHLDDYKIVLILNYGDGCSHKKGTILLNTIDIYNENELINDIDYGISSDNDIFDTEENIKILRQEQKELYKYLTKHFENISIEEVKG